MRIGRVLVIAVGVSMALTIGMFVFEIVTLQAAASWVYQGTEFSDTQRFRIMLAAWWSRFWWLGVPAIVITVSSFVAAYFFVRRAITLRKGIAD